MPMTWTAENERALVFLVDEGMPKADAHALMPGLVAFAEETGTDLADVASAAAMVYDGLAGDPKRVEGVLQVLRSSSGCGHCGAVELADLELENKSIVARAKTIEVQVRFSDEAKAALEESFFEMRESLRKFQDAFLLFKMRFEKWAGSADANGAADDDASTPRDDIGAPPAMPTR